MALLSRDQNSSAVENARSSAWYQMPDDEGSTYCMGTFREAGTR
ncbi:MAG: hypothetical protein ACOY71_01460 [Gemmatimonadota bacterium]